MKRTGIITFAPNNQPEEVESGVYKIHTPDGDTLNLIGQKVGIDCYQDGNDFYVYKKDEAWPDGRRPVSMLERTFDGLISDSPNLGEVVWDD